MQLLLAQFSRANSRLAVENEKLRSGRQELMNDHAEVLNEIEHLRNRLCLLEECTSGAQQDERSGSSQARARTGITHSHLETRTGKECGAGGISGPGADPTDRLSEAQRHATYVKMQWTSSGKWNLS